MLINPMTLMVFTRALNHYVKLDPQSDVHLRPLVGSVLCLDLTGSGKQLYFQFNEDEILVEQTFEGKPDATLFASPVDLAKLFVSKGGGVLDDNVRLEGKVRFVQDVQTLFSSLDIDWEEHLSRMTGDVFAHHATRLASSVKNIFQDIGKSTTLNTVEFLQEEADILVVPERVSRFCDAVDSTAMQADRLAARIADLKKKCSE